MASFEEFAKKTRRDVVEDGTPFTELEQKMEDYIFFDDMGAIHFALKVEVDEFSIYRKLASKTIDTNVKALSEEFWGGTRSYKTSKKTTGEDRQNSGRNIITIHIGYGKEVRAANCRTKDFSLLMDFRQTSKGG